MDSIRSYAEGLARKELLAQILSMLFPNVSEDAYEDVVAAIEVKLNLIDTFRNNLVNSSNNNEDLLKIAKGNNITVNAVIDSFVYFSLVTENVILNKIISDIKGE